MRTIGLVGLGAQKLLRPNGENLNSFHPNAAAGDVILAANLEGAGCKVRRIDLGADTDEVAYDETRWCGETLTKVMVGTPVEKACTDDLDAVGVPVRCLADREPACRAIAEMKRRGLPVVVGGAEVVCSPAVYLEAGADVAVCDSTGRSNRAAIEIAFGQPPSGEHQLMTRPGVIGGRLTPLHPEDWPLPSVETARAYLGGCWEGPGVSTLKVGAVITSHGCGNNCPWCMTAGVPYQAMSPGRVRQWLEVWKLAGAEAVAILDDNFLWRLKRRGGRKEVLAIMAIVRELGLRVFWENGLQLSLMMRGSKPDRELIQALCGGDVCELFYVPAERPGEGPEVLAKLSPWKMHLELVRAIAEVEVLNWSYGWVHCLPDDSYKTYGRMAEAVFTAGGIAKAANSKIRFRVWPFPIRPFGDTPTTRQLREEGLWKYRDPLVSGATFSPCARTRWLSVEEVFACQELLRTLGD